MTSKNNKRHCLQQADEKKRNKVASTKQTYWNRKLDDRFCFIRHDYLYEQGQNVLWGKQQKRFCKSRITKFVAFVNKSKSKQLSQTDKINISTNKALSESAEKMQLAFVMGRIRSLQIATRAAAASLSNRTVVDD